MTVLQPTLLSGLGSSDPGGTIVSYAWDFGDGGTSTQPLVGHAFATPGVKTVTLTVTDDDGLSSSCTTTVTVTP